MIPQRPYPEYLLQEAIAANIPHHSWYVALKSTVIELRAGIALKLNVESLIVHYTSYMQLKNLPILRFYQNTGKKAQD
jgi:hypothetical protein